MRCSELTEDRPVVFKIYSDILKRKIPMDGTVHCVYPEQKEVCVSWLDGYRDRKDNIPYDDMIAAYDENGEMMKFDNISGKSVLLIAE